MWAQEAPTLTINANVVTLLATVHDRSGRIVNNLRPDDFVLEEDGKPQKIRYFSRESDLPLTIGRVDCREGRTVLGSSPDPDKTLQITRGDTRS